MRIDEAFMKYHICLLFALLMPIASMAGDASDLLSGLQMVGVADSVPCIIITDTAMSGVFAQYAAQKTCEGTLTDVLTIDAIAEQYVGGDLPQKVRNCIRDYHQNKYTEWVILGGDLDVIPGVYVYSQGDYWLSDTYYSNLEYEWNENCNEFFAEPAYKGDTVDYSVDVYVGRIPCSTPQQASAVVSKLTAYLRSPSDSDYQTRALFTGTNVYGEDDVFQGDDRDSYRLLSELSAYLPDGYTDTILYATASSNVKTELSRGNGLIVNSSQAQDGCSYLTNWTSTWVRSKIDHTFFADSMDNAGRYGVFVNLTCYNADLSNACAVARDFMLNPSGGGVAYIGATHYNWSTIGYPGFHREMFRLMFEEGVTEPAKAMSLAKSVLVPQDGCTDNSFRSAYFSYIYLGDPQMKIWTATPHIVDVSAPDTVYLTEPSITISVTSGGLPVPDVRLCLSKDASVYVIGETDDEGNVTFSDLSYNTAGAMSVVATCDNCFTTQDWIQIVASCCVGMKGNVDCSPDDVVSLGDFTALNDFLFESMTPLCCEEEADMDGDGQVSLGDLTALIDYLFISLEPLDNCD